MKPKIVEIYEISWIPFLFGLNTIYNIFEYLRTLNNNRLVKIKNLEELLNNTNNKCNELQNKYDILYDNFQQLNTKINNLDVKIFELNDTKIDELNSETITSEIHIKENAHNSEDINNEFIESLSLDYDHNENVDSEKTFDDDCNIVRTRSISLTEFNLAVLTKKLFFG
jgi:hypothetical protein